MYFAGMFQGLKIWGGRAPRAGQNLGWRTFDTCLTLLYVHAVQGRLHIIYRAVVGSENLDGPSTNVMGVPRPPGFDRTDYKAQRKAFKLMGTYIIRSQTTKTFFYVYKVENVII